MGAPKITDKRWSIDLEKRIQEEHYGESYSTRYSFDPASKKEIFVIDTPPPYPSGTWHFGAVAQYSMIDVIARSCLLYTSPSPRDRTRSRMPSSA